MVTIALIVIGVLVAYFLLVLHAPLVRCPGCWGKRVRRLGRSGTSRVRIIKCPLCDATGIYRMPAATTVHRFFWSLAGDHIHDSARADVTERIKQQEEEQS